MSRYDSSDGNVSDDQLSDRSVVLLEELIKNNKELLDSNRKLKEELKSKGDQQERVLRDLTNKLDHALERERNSQERRIQPARKRQRLADKVPTGCRRKVREMYNTLLKKDDFQGFSLDEVVASETNQTAFSRTTEALLHNQGGEAKCPWSRGTINDALKRYFTSCVETAKLRNDQKYEEHKRRSRRNGRKREKLTKRTLALEKVNWTTSKKGRVAEVLMTEVMSSEESDYEEDGKGGWKVTSYSVKRLPWQSHELTKVKKKLDKTYLKTLSSRAKERVLDRKIAREASNRQQPDGLQEWAIVQSE